MPDQTPAPASAERMVLEMVAVPREALAIEPGGLVAAAMPSDRTAWMFADYCTGRDTPVRDGEIGVLLERTADRRMENYYVRLLGRDHNVVLNVAELRALAAAQPAPAPAPAEQQGLLVRLTDEIAGQVERRTAERDSHTMGSKEWFYREEEVNTLENVLRDMRYALDHGVTRLEFERAVALGMPLPPTAPTPAEARAEAEELEAYWKAGFLRGAKWQYGKAQGGNPENRWTMWQGEQNECWEAAHHSWPPVPGRIEDAREICRLAAQAQAEGGS